MADPLEDVRRQAIAAHRAGRNETALRAYASYLAARPDDAQIWTNLGALFRAMGLHDHALLAQERAFATAPDMNGVRNNLANILGDLGQYDRSIGLRREILEATPQDLPQLALIGRALRSKGDLDAAIDHLTEVHRTHPDAPEIELQLAFALLHRGEIAKGFEHYEARWETGEATRKPSPVPYWDGASLKGKRVLVLPEQGFGDALMVLRYMPALAETAAELVCMVEAPLRRLLSGLDVERSIDHVDKAGEVDVAVHYLDLPRFAVPGSDIPPPTRVHVPDDSRMRAADITAPYREKFRIGCVWTGSMTYKGNRFRSIGHRSLLALAADTRVQLFSLYKGQGLDALRADGSDAFLLDTGSTERDFADTAAMMEAMDLVVTTDTATAHLAGCLGKEAWVLLHWDPFWVYGQKGDRTPWYPTHRLFRQRTPGDWAPVMAEVTAALSKRMENG